MLGDPNDAEHTEMKRWVGRAFDPEQLELEKTNKTLAVLARRLDKALWGQQRRS